MAACKPTPHSRKPSPRTRNAAPIPTLPAPDPDEEQPIRYARPWMGAFLLVLARKANISAAARAAKIKRQTAYTARDTDKAFAAGWEDALQEAADVIREELHRRAIEGWEEPVFGMLGKKGDGEGIIGTVHKYDSGLLARLAQAHCAEFRKDAAPSTLNVNIQITPEKLRQLQERMQASFQPPLDRN